MIIPFKNHRFLVGLVVLTDIEWSFVTFVISNWQKKKKKL